MADGTQVRGGTPGAAPVRRLMSFDEFLVAENDEHVEWVRGEVVPLSPVGDLESDLASFLYVLIRFSVDARGAGAVRQEPFIMKTGPDLPGRSPDILYVSRANLERLRQAHLEGPADLVVEVVTPDSGARDRGEKFYEYEAGGVREYWLVEPGRRRAEFYARAEDGAYRPIQVGADAVFRSVVLEGFWLNVGWLWQRPLPPVPDVIREMGLL